MALGDGQGSEQTTATTDNTSGASNATTDANATTDSTVTNTETVQGTRTDGKLFDTLVNKPEIPADVSDLATGVLKGVPAHLVPVLAPYVKEWDKGFQAKLTEVKSQYSGFEGITPEAAKSALELQQLIDSNPTAALEAIRELYDLAQESASETEDPEDEASILDTLPPEIRNKLAKVDQLEKIVQIVADREISRANEAKLADSMKEYDAVLADLEKKHGKFDLEYVNTLVASGDYEPAQAVEKYVALANAIAAEKLAAHSKAPVVLGGAGSVLVNEGTSPKDLPSKDRRSYVAKLLAEANKNS